MSRLLTLALVRSGEGMSKSFIFLALVGASTLLVRSQSVPHPDASAVWQTPGGFVANAKTACGSSSGSQFGDCLIQQMVKAGASAASVTFTRDLFKETHGEVGVMTSFQKGTPVDIAWVTYPWRPDHKYGLLLLNGQPAIVNVEDLKRLDQRAMRESLQYKSLQKQFARLDIFPGDRDGKTFPDSQPSPNGGAQFVLNYPLRNGCPNCGNAGSAMFTWNFDKDGKFVGTSFMGLLSPPLN
jgi:hypothetical protein